LKNGEVKAETWSNHWELQIFGDGNSSHLQIPYMCVINRYTVDAVWRTKRRRRRREILIVERLPVWQMERT
jgi:hypothetical protein